MNPNPARAVLRVRSLAPHGINGTQTEIIERLQRLDTDGSISELDVDVWGTSMGMGRAVGRNPSDVRETIAEFEQWADEHGCTLRPAFERRTHRCLESDGADPETVVVLPLFCLGVYDGTTVTAVYPHIDDETVHTIHDGVEALESMAAGDEQLTHETREKRTSPLH